MLIQGRQDMGRGCVCWLPTVQALPKALGYKYSCYTHCTGEEMK